MSQCVPNWELHDSPSVRLPTNTNTTTTTTPNISMLEGDYEIAELTWENGQLSMHGLRPTRSISSACKPQFSSSKYTNTNTTTPTTTALDEKQIRAGGTLESIVNQAAQLHPAAAIKVCPILQGTSQDINVPWFDQHQHHHHQATTTSATAATLDALVPSSNGTNSNVDIDNSTLVPRVGAGIGGGWSTTHASVGGKRVAENHEEVTNYARKRKSTISVAKVPVLVQPQEGTGSRNHYQSLTAGSANSSRNNDSSWHMNNNTLDMTCDVGFTTTASTSLGCSVPENYYTAKSSGKPSPPSYTTPVVNNIDDPDYSDSQISKPDHQQGEDKRGDGEEDKKKKGQSGKSSASTRRSRAAAIHNQSERKRRDKINQKMKTLQKLVPNSNKTDKASMLDEVIEYIKQLQAQVHMANRMSMATAPHMMMAPPVAMTTMQQQLQLFLMTQMGMGTGMAGMHMGMVPDIITAMSSMGHQNHPNIPGVPSFIHPNAAFTVADPLSTFLACQSPNMNTSMESYSRMAALFQQLNQTQTPAVPNSKTY